MSLGLALPQEVVLPGAWAPMACDEPHFVLDPSTLFEEVEALRALRGAAQDPVFHAEGDVAIHTERVVEALQNLGAFRALSKVERVVVALACLLHDVAKPTTMAELGDGRISHPGHARKGARMARRLLWQAGVDVAVREAVCGLIRLHELPFYLIESEDPERRAIRASVLARCDLLSIVARADVLGRACEEGARLLDNVELFAAQCEELGCLATPFPFPSDHTRFLYLQGKHRSPRVEAWDDTRCEVVVMSGLPGAGKDTWLQNHDVGLEVISLDALRAELGVAPSDKQGRVVQEAQERAKELLRQGRGFCWNATNVSRTLRQRVVDLAVRYGARVRIVYVEAPADRLFVQNRGRQDAVPAEVTERLLARWEVPDATEAREVIWVSDAVAGDLDAGP